MSEPLYVNDYDEYPAVRSDMMGQLSEFPRERRCIIALHYTRCQIGWAIEGSDAVIRMNTGGDLAADAVIRIAGVHALGAGAFLL